MRARAITFDFNGTLSDDEPILFEVFAGLFAERGRPLTADDYFGILAGLSDTAIDRKSTRLNSSHVVTSRMPSSA